jgi:hypothetical protein
MKGRPAGYSESNLDYSFDCRGMSFEKQLVAIANCYATEGSIGLSIMLSITSPTNVNFQLKKISFN